jgi:hypothetical protein
MVVPSPAQVETSLTGMSGWVGGLSDGRLSEVCGARDVASQAMERRSLISTARVVAILCGYSVEYIVKKSLARVRRTHMCG